MRWRRGLVLLASAVLQGSSRWDREVPSRPVGTRYLEHDRVNLSGATITALVLIA